MLPGAPCRADRRDETYQYDPNGNLTQVIDRKGQVTIYGYDPLNRLTQITYADLSTTSLTYDGGNRLTQMVNSLSGTTTFSYDSLDRLTSKTTPQGTIGYSYDAAGRRTSMSVAGQSTVNYTYDNGDRLTQVTQGSTTVTIAYDNAGRRTSLTLPNGLVTEYTYDAASQLTGITYKYGANTLGNLTYGYDAAGHRAMIGGSYARSGLPLAVTTASHNAANQQTAFGSQSLTYDLNGNLTSDGTNTYTWNARDQLASMTDPGLTASFQYDASGKRTSKTVNGATTTYLYDGADLVQEQTGGVPSANILVGGLDEVFTRTDGTGTWSPLVDGVGSILALTDAGAVRTEYTYEPFGKTTVSGAASSNSSQYTGRENDGTGLYFFRSRYYSPTLQRFISEDPIGLAGGINLYGYAGNNPISFSDPFGLKPHNPGDDPDSNPHNPAPGDPFGRKLHNPGDDPDSNPQNRAPNSKPPCIPNGSADVGVEGILPVFVGPKGGVQLDSKGVYPYFGLAAGTPGKGLAVTGGNQMVSPGISLGFSAAFILGFSYSSGPITGPSFGQALRNGTWQFGGGTPGASANITVVLDSPRFVRRIWPCQ
jgi:RHS repeat-associated protein